MVLNALYEARTKWNSIGLELGMNHSDLAAIKQRNREDPDECFKELLNQWLTRTNPKPTWEAVVRALESQTVGYGQLAERIKEEHLAPECNTTQSVNGQQPSNGFNNGDFHCSIQDSTTNSTAQSINEQESTFNGSNKEHFHCPCGKCDLLSYLDNGCPKSNSKQYPYLELTQLDEGDKEDLLQKLSDDTANIIKRFANLLTTTGKSLKCRNIQVDELVKVALDLGAYKSNKNQLPLLDEDQQKLQQANSIDSAFIILRRHMSFFNYEILSHIIDHLGSENDQEELANYCSQFKTFCERRIFEVPPSVFDPSGQKRKDRKLFVVLGTEDLFQTLNDVKAAQRKIASLLGLRVSTLQLKQVDLASVILVFSVPASVGHHLSYASRSLGSMDFILIIPGLSTHHENLMAKNEDTINQTSMSCVDEIDQASRLHPDEVHWTSMQFLAEVHRRSVLSLASNDSGFISRSPSQITLNSLGTPLTITRSVYKRHSIIIPEFSAQSVANQMQYQSNPASSLHTAVLMKSTSSDKTVSLMQKSLKGADQLKKLVALFSKKNKMIGVFYDSKQKQKANSIIRRLKDLLSGGVCIVQGFEIFPLTSNWLQRALLGGVDYFIFVGLPPSVTTGNIPRSQLPQTITETAFFDIWKYVQRVAEVVVVLTEQRDGCYSHTPHYLDKFLHLESENMEKVAEDALALFAGK